MYIHIYIYIYIHTYYIYIHIYIYIYIYIYSTSFKLSTLSTKVLIVTNRVKIFVEGIINNNQLSLHGVSRVLPNLQMAVQYYFTCKNKMKTHGS